MTTLINLLILLIFPFITDGIIKKTKAFWAGRKGASIFQPFFDFLKLLKKECVYSRNTSFVFKITPVISLSTVLFAGLLLPLATGNPIINIPFSFVIFSYILGLGKFFALISALDTGSSFEGMGASREACFSTIVEPAFFIALGSIVPATGINTFDNLKAIISSSGLCGYLIIALAVITLFIMILAEGCRVPVDDPETHLELTMIHEVMILDNSGTDLAFMTRAASMKIFLISSLIAALIIPAKLPVWISVSAYAAILALIAVVIGTIESSSARFRMTHVFEFIFIMSVTALLILTMVIYGIYGN